ncbi:MAG: UDP-N-acetylmuramoyl-L-alanyl-D-glutamate--2,6-diaminopimelate ligase [Cellvibrionaceae bacterium]
MASNKKTVIKRLGELLPDNVLTEAFANIVVSGLTIDSRSVKDGYVFVAMQGVQVHGRQFVEQAINNGAVAILIDASDEPVEASIPVITVANLEMYLSQMASYFYGNPSTKIPVVGITGTNGKTTCSQLLAQCLAHLKVPCGVMGTLGYGLFKSSVDNIAENLQSTGMTTADAIRTQSICAELVDSGAQYMVMEVSSHGLCQHRVAAIDIDTAVFTNLSHDHLDYHGNMLEYGQAKSRLFSMASVSNAIINQDDDYAEILIETIPDNVKVITYSLSDAESNVERSENHFSLSSITMGEQGMEATLVVDQHSFPIKTPLIGQFNLSNLLAVVSTLTVYDIAINDIVSAIATLKSVPGRMELIPNQLGLRVVVDFAHTPDALKSALLALSPHKKGKVWCVFGCGGDRDREKRPQMAAIAQQFSDKVIVTSDNPRNESPVTIFSDIEKGFGGSVDHHEIIADRANAIESAIEQAQSGDIVLIAGKGHEDYQLIGSQRFPFSDQQQARFSLRCRESREAQYD